MNSTDRQALLLKQPGSCLGDLLAQGLAAAGVSVTVASTPYDLVVEAERAAGTFSHIVVPVDYFGRDEFRLFPLVRREWPDTVLAAYHSPGFEHKGLLADLVGADFVLSGDADVSRFIEALCARPASPRPPAPARPARVEAPPEKAAPQVVPPPAGPVAPAAPEPPADRVETAVFAASLRAALAHSTQEADAGEAAASSPPVPPPPPVAAARQPGATRERPPRPTPHAADAEPVVELTDEELRMLLRQEDEE